MKKIKCKISNSSDCQIFKITNFVVISNQILSISNLTKRQAELRSHFCSYNTFIKWIFLPCKKKHFPRGGHPSPLMHHQAASGEFSAVFFNSFLRKMRSQSLKYMVQRDGSRKGGVTIHTKIDVQNTAFHSMHFKNHQRPHL